jgi:alkanesulfonate monooxygenase SsuD/methylene tetrahydromethanopterin reductase-like flavin-dependent oxidoreductase (luciferase family)
MRIGTSLTSRHVVADPREGARFMIERAAAARQARLDSLFLGDHHATPVPYYQNVPMLGRLLAEWGDAPAGCLFLLPLWNPTLVAEQVGTLAAAYRERCAAHGTTPAAVAIRRDVYVGESAAEARAVLAEAVARGYRGMAPDALVAGSIDEVVERLGALAALGYTDVIVRHLTDDQAKVLGSLSRLEKVRAALAPA